MDCLLKDVAIIKNGKDYKNVECKEGEIPILGTGGIISYTNQYLYDGESVLIGRKGTINNPQYINGKFWTVDTLFYTEINKDICLPKVLHYYLSLISLEKLDEGTSIPSLTQSTLYNLRLKLPSMNVQRHIVDNITKGEKIYEN